MSEEINLSNFGSEFLSNYEILDVLGCGMSGPVYLGLQKSLQRKVAIKYLDKLSPQAENLRSRFKREAQVLTSLSHPNIVEVLDTGLDGSTYFIVQRLLPGPSLADLIHDGQVLSLPDVLKIGCDVAEALAAAHSAQVIHRDIKPENIMADEDGRFLLLDFGLAISDTYCTALTKSGCTVGTLNYMAPEQLLGAAYSSEVDVYSFGTVLYLLLSGRLPFDVRKDPNPFRRTREKAESITATCSYELPASLVKLVDACLCIDPQARPANGGEVLSALKKIKKERHSPKTSQKPPQRSTSPKLFLITLITILSIALYHYYPKAQISSNQNLNKRMLQASLSGPFTVTLKMAADPPCRGTVLLEDKAKKKVLITHTHSLQKTTFIQQFPIPAGRDITVRGIFNDQPEATVREIQLTTPKVRAETTWSLSDSQKSGTIKNTSYLECSSITGSESLLFFLLNSVQPLINKSKICCWSLKAKRLLWIKEEHMAIKHIVAVNESLIAIRYDGSTKAFHAHNGRSLWSTSSQGKEIDRKLFYVKSGILFLRMRKPNNIFAIRLIDGKILWKRKGEDFRSDWVVNNDGNVYAPVHFTGCLILNALSGEATKASPIFPDKVITTTPWLGPKGVYAGVLSGKICRTNLHNNHYSEFSLHGAARFWRALSGLLVCLCENPPQLLAYSPAKNTIVWRVPLNKPTESWFTSAAGLIFLRHLNAKRVQSLSIIHGQSGLPLAEIEVSTSGLKGPYLSKGRAYFALREGRIISISI